MGLLYSKIIPRQKFPIPRAPRFFVTGEAWARFSCSGQAGHEIQVRGSREEIVPGLKTQDERDFFDNTDRYL